MTRRRSNRITAWDTAVVIMAAAYLLIPPVRDAVTSWLAGTLG